MTYLPRLAQDRLAERTDAFRVVVVNGPRQAGKTTLLRLFETARGGSLRSLDDATTLRSALADPAGFARFGAGPRMIDEVQRGGDDLVVAIKYVVDRDDTPGQFILSGSTRFLTVPTISESLAGRAVFVEVWPFAVAERTGAPADFCSLLFNDPGRLAEAAASPWTRDRYADLFCTGGFPEVLRLQAANLRHGWFDGYLSTVVLRDVASFAQVRHAEFLPRLLALVTARAGSQLVVSEVAQSLQLNQATVRDYLTYLDTVFLTGRVSPWASNITTRLVKTPKVYPTDSGLAAHLLQVDADALMAPGHPSLGAMVECFVYAELTRLLAGSDLGASLHFYRDHDGREVDFVLERGNGQVVGIEVKASSSVGAADFRHLRWLRDRVGDRFAGGYVLYLGTESLPFGDGMTALPLSAMWHHHDL